MKKVLSLAMILFLITGCAATFKEKRALSRPMVSLAMSRIQQNDIQGALIELRKAHKINPDDPEIYYGLALVYAKSDKIDKALDNIEKTINKSGRLDLEHPGIRSEAYNLKGTIMFGLKRFDEALKAFDNALENELYKTAEYPLHNKAHVYLETKRLDEALESARQALMYNQHYAPAWEVSAKIFVAMGRLNDAIDALKHAILEFPGYTDAHWEIAQIYIQLGEPDKAVSHLNELIRLDPKGAFGVMAQERLKNIQEKK